jgi:hypothetical protein
MLIAVRVPRVLVSALLLSFVRPVSNAHTGQISRGGSHSL